MNTIWLKDFATMREAEDYLKARGFSVGRMQGPAPRGILFGNVDIQKWRNLDSADRAALHGWIIRYGTVPPYGERAHITIYEHAPDEAHAAIRAE